MTKPIVTQWFPPDVKPVHIGLYRTIPQHWLTPCFEVDYIMAYWNGSRWNNEIEIYRLSAQNRWWRGLTEESK